MSNSVQGRVAVNSPYPGIRPFRRDESQFFFGRDDQIEALLLRLHRSQFLAVVGASGSGKSSLVKAGLIPELEAGGLGTAGSDWRVADMRPGNSPLLNLAREILRCDILGPDWPKDSKNFDISLGLLLARLSVGPRALVELLHSVEIPKLTNLLIVADQFEEIFRFYTDHSANEALKFVNLLIATAEDSSVPAYVVLTMRSDYLGECALFPGLPELLNDTQFLCPRLSRDQMREAIELPARLRGSEVECGLASQMINDIGANSDQLPLVQHALMRTWRVAQPVDAEKLQSETPRRLTLQHYLNPQVGGVAKALDSHAEEIYRSLGASPGISDSNTEPKRRSPHEVFLELYFKSFLPFFKKHFEGELPKDPRAFDAAQEQFLKRYPYLHDISKAFLRSFRNVLNIPEERPPTLRQRVCERMFRCLSDVNSRGQVVRRLASISEIQQVTEGASIDDVIEVAKPFLTEGCSFLTASPKDAPLSKETTLDISHEALLRQWERLKGWIKTEQRSAEIYRRLSGQAYRRRVGEASLWRFADLAPVERWIEQERPTATWATRYAQPEREEASFMESKDFLKRSRRRLAIWNWSKVGLFVVSILAVVSFYRLWINATFAKKSAESLSYVNQMVSAQYEWRDGNYPVAVDYLRKAQPALRGWEHNFLLTRVNQTQRTFRGHSEPVNCVAMSKDGKWIVTGSDDKTVKILRTESGETLTFTGHSNPVLCLAMSADSKRIVSGDSEGNVKVWNRAAKSNLLTLDSHKHAVWSVAISDDGTRIVGGTSKGDLKVWDLDSNSGVAKQTHKPDAHKAAVKSVAITGDGKQIVSGSDDRRIALWDAETKTKQVEFDHGESVKSVAISADGKRIISGGSDFTVKVWDRLNNNAEPSFTLRGHTSSVYGVAITADGKRIASGGRDFTVMVWDAMSGQAMLTLKGHENSVVSVAISADGKHIVSGSMDNTAKLWDAVIVPETRSLNGHKESVESVAVSPDGKWVISGSVDKTLKLWDAASGKELRTLHGHTEAVKSVAMSEDGKRIISGSNDKTVKVWDAATGELMRTFDKHKGSVYCVNTSGDGQRIVSGSSDGAVKVWSAENGQEISLAKGHDESVYCVAISADGQRIVSGGEDMTVKVWDTASGRETLTFRGHTVPVYGVAISRDGKWVVSGSSGRISAGEMKVWDIANGREMLPINDRNNSILCVAIGANERRLFCGCKDKSVKVWDIESGLKTLTLMGHVGRVTGLAISADGTRLVSGSEDGTVKVWDAPASDRVNQLDVGPTMSWTLGRAEAGFSMP